MGLVDQYLLDNITRIFRSDPKEIVSNGLLISNYSNIGTKFKQVSKICLYIFFLLQISEKYIFLLPFLDPPLIFNLETCSISSSKPEHSPRSSDSGNGAVPGEGSPRHLLPRPGFVRVAKKLDLVTVSSASVIISRSAFRYSYLFRFVDANLSATRVRHIRRDGFSPMNHKKRERETWKRTVLGFIGYLWRRSPSFFTHRDT